MSIIELILTQRIQELEALLQEQEIRAVATIGHLVRKAGGRVVISREDVENQFLDKKTILHIHCEMDGSYTYELKREQPHLTLVQDAPEQLM